MVDKNYKNDKLYTQTKIMYMKFIMRKERKKQINKQIQRIGKKEGKQKQKERNRKEKKRTIEINKRRK